MNDDNHDNTLRTRPSRLRSPATAWSLLFAAVVFGAIFATDRPQAAHDDTGVQQAVQSQLQAFASQDAGRAFALADPSLRTRFSTAQEFLETVRTQYPMVAKPISVLFLKPASDGTIALQKVRVTDSEGSAWMVTYLLNRSGSGQWLISGTLVEPDGIGVTV
jgi:hypothetical protein